MTSSISSPSLHLKLHQRIKRQTGKYSNYRCNLGYPKPWTKVRKMTPKGLSAQMTTYFFSLADFQSSDTKYWHHCTNLTAIYHGGFVHQPWCCHAMINNFDPSRRASKPKWAQSSWSIDDPFPLPYFSKSLLPIFQRHQSIKINNAHTVEKFYFLFNKFWGLRFRLSTFVPNSNICLIRLKSKFKSSFYDSKPKLWNVLLHTF